jgi:hypothetical protein
MVTCLIPLSLVKSPPATPVALFLECGFQIVKLLIFSTLCKLDRLKISPNHQVVVPFCLSALLSIYLFPFAFYKKQQEVSLHLQHFAWQFPRLNIQT